MKGIYRNKCHPYNCSTRIFHVNSFLSPASATDKPSKSAVLENLANVYQLPKLISTNELRVESVGALLYSASVALPPSLAINIRRGSLLAVQGDPTHVSFSRKFLDPLKRFMYGNLTSRYTQVMCTEPMQLLVSSKADTPFRRLVRNSTPKALAPISLDGKSDWALLKRDSLHLFGGSSLMIETAKVPSKILRQLAKTLGSKRRSGTGLFSWWCPGYTLVGGRGVIGVVGSGLIYSVDVAASEEFSVNTSCLVGVSVNGPNDLQNVVVRAEQKPIQIPAVIVPPIRVLQVKTFNDAITNAKHYLWIAAKAIKDSWHYLKRHTSETPGFVRIIGPRTVLLQGGSNYNLYECNFEVPSLESYGTVLPMEEAPIPRVAADYLNTVTVGPKGVSIESTDSFLKDKREAAILK